MEEKMNKLDFLEDFQDRLFFGDDGEEIDKKELRKLFNETLKETAK